MMNSSPSFALIRAAGAPARAEGFLGPAAGMKDARVVAAEFAGLFYTMMLEEMQKTVGRNEYFGSRGEEVFRSFWIDEVSRSMAERRGDPLSSQIYDEIVKRSGHVAAGEQE